MSSEEKLGLALSLIDRLDRLGSSTANRATIVISADTLFQIAATFLLDSFLSSYVSRQQQTVTTK